MSKFEKVGRSIPFFVASGRFASTSAFYSLILLELVKAEDSDATP
jgi:hypothetical protein